MLHPSSALQSVRIAGLSLLLHIQAWASALPSDMNRAMREASSSRTAKIQIPTLFSFYNLTPTRGRPRLGSAYDMIGLIGASFYDSLNKFIIGFLFLLPFIAVFMPSTTFAMAIWSVSAWLFGVGIWGVCTYLCQNCVEFEKIYIKNNIKVINEEYIKILNEYKKKGMNLPKELDHEMDKIDYINAYYYVEKNGLLGNIPIMESYSAFFFYLRIVLIWWTLCLICSNGVKLFDNVSMDYSYYSFTRVIDNSIAEITINPLFLILIIGIMLVFSFAFRKNTERLIYHNLLEAYIFHKLK